MLPAQLPRYHIKCTGLTGKILLESYRDADIAL
jgi:hypothetical protein